MFHTGIPTKIRCIKYGVKHKGSYFYVQRPYGVIYHSKANELVEVICEEHQYDSLNVKGRQVVDIGADCGDSSIQFAYRGAKEVYSYEPNVSAIRALDMTLTANKYKNISQYNEAVLGKAGYVSIDANAEANRAGKLTNGSFRIKATTLNEIVDKHKIKDGVLKMDCEGYEYEIFDGATDKTLLAFNEMAIELHKGAGKIIDRLGHLGYAIEQKKAGKDKNMFVIFARR